ncbi:MAG: M20/M25/M40 family metallo-hydrolase, partial [Eubacteriales bacterium]|nr:M20/M25/M40 family metallo-hydrolase [Eubacteriales bacterium]
MDPDDFTRDLTGRFSEMIRCRTVSYKDTSLEDPAEFKRFRDLLVSMYPGVSAVCVREEIGRTGLLYRWKGRGDGRPLVLMAHYDVVPVDASQWEKEPFAAEIDNGIVWGRGTLDTKGTLCGIMEAAEKLI